MDEMTLGLQGASVDAAAHDEQACVLVRGEWKRLAAGRLATKAVRQVMVASAASVERAVDSGGPLLALLLGDHRGTSYFLMGPVSPAEHDATSEEKRNRLP